MKRSTRILSIIMAFAMIVSSMVVVASAEEATPTISVVAGEVENGQVSVDIVLAGNPGVISMQLDLNYDEDLTIASVADGGKLGVYHHSDNTELNPYILFWSNGDAESNYVVDGTIATVVFNVPEDLEPGSYEISVDYNGNDNKQIIDFDGKEVEFELVADEIVVEPPFIAVDGIALDAEAATLLEGETLQLTATVTPADATEPAVTWTSSDDAIATVVDGLVTAVAEGEATITAKAGDKTATCVVTVEKAEVEEPEEPVATPVAKIGETETTYASVAEALAAAEDGQTVVLVADAKEDMIFVREGVALDLAGFVLEAEFIYGVNGSSVYDSSAANTGLAKVARGRMALSAENGGAKQMPVWNNVDGYMFAKMTTNAAQMTASTDDGLKFQMRHRFSSSVNFGGPKTGMDNAYFADGTQDNGVDIQYRLVWDYDVATGVTGYQEFIYSSYFVSQTYGNKSGTLTLELFNTSTYDNLQVIASVVSETGVAVETVVAYK